VLTVLQQLLRVAMPQEGCALLLGCNGVPAWEIGEIWPCLNAWEPAGERARRFRLDPREQLLAQRWARERGLQVLGAAHSHPCSTPVPSATDRDLAVAPTLQLILSPLADWAPACWWLDLDRDGAVTARPLRWRMVD